MVAEQEYRPCRLKCLFKSSKIRIEFSRPAYGNQMPVNGWPTALGSSGW